MSDEADQVALLQQRLLPYFDHFTHLRPVLAETAEQPHRKTP